MSGYDKDRQVIGINTGIMLLQVAHTMLPIDRG